MKKIVLIISLFLLLLSTTKTSFADDEHTSSPSTTRREALELKKTEHQETITQRKEEFQANVVARRRTNITKFLARMIARLKAMVARIELLITRIESRLDKIATENPDEDLTAIKADVEEAKTLLNETKDKITDLETTGDELIESDTPKVVFKEVREKLADIKKDLVEVHRILVQVIGDIKGLRVGDDNNETE